MKPNSRLELQPGAVSGFPAPDEVERRSLLLNEITELPYVAQSVLAPYVKLIPNSPDAALAAREMPQYGMRQILYGIIYAGTQGFGLSKAYGSGLHANGQAFVTKINEDPYMKETQLVGCLYPGASLILGGKSQLVPDLKFEGHHFKIWADRGDGDIRVQSLQHKNGLLSLVSATGWPSERPKNSSPLDEVGTWSVAPGFLRKSLVRAHREHRLAGTEKATRTVRVA